MPRYLLSLFLTSALVGVSLAFQPPQHCSLSVLGHGLSQGTYPRTQIILHSTSEEKKEKDKKKGPFDEGLRTKLVSESIAPWRTLRLFLYGSLGSGAAVGGFITLAGTAAALSGSRTDLDLNTELMNLAIDFGAVAVFAVLAKYDIDKGNELQEKVDAKIEMKKQQKGKVREIKKREKQLQNLDLGVTVSADGATQMASVRDLQQGANQHMIIVAGPRKACKDALIGANLLKMDFAMSNVLVVPYDTEADTSAVAEVNPTAGGGFGERPSYETQPYVARAYGEEWSQYIKDEMKDAIEQNGESVKEEGIAIVVANTGNVIRRGVGTVPWRSMVEQLQSGDFE